MTILFILPIQALGYLTSCAAMLESPLRDSLSSKATAIEKTVYVKDVQGCRMPGNVAGSSMPGDVNGDDGKTSLNNALVEAREQAVKPGASHMLITALNKAADITFEHSIANVAMDITPQLDGSAIDGEASRCN